MRRLIVRTAGSLAAILIAAVSASAQDGAAAYAQNCAACHDAGVDRAPSREALQAMTAERVLAALESGAMISMASRSSAAERRAIAQFVTGKSLSKKDVDMTPAPQSMCAPAGDFTNPLTGPTLERLGRQHLQHALSGRRSGRTLGSGCAPSQSEMGVRLSRRSRRQRAADHRRRPRVRRQPGRQGLFAQRRHGLHPLVRASGRRRARSGHDRPDRDAAPDPSTRRSSAT